MDNRKTRSLDPSVDQEVHSEYEPLSDIDESHHITENLTQNENGNKDDTDLSRVNQRVHFKAAKSEKESSHLLFEDVPDDIGFSDSMVIDAEYDAHVQSNTVELLSDEHSNAATVMTTAIHWFTMPLYVLFKYTCPPAGEGTGLRVLARSVHSY